MEKLFINEERYMKIIEFIRIYKNINKDEMFRILKDRDCKYLLLLLLEKYKCADVERLCDDFTTVSSKSIKYNMKKAEEKFFVNKEFRDMYFRMEEVLKKII